MDNIFTIDVNEAFMSRALELGRKGRGRVSPNPMVGCILVKDGEIIGEGVSDDEEWCHFTANDASEITCSAPSPWMLHDAITAWVESCSNSKQV